MSLGVINGRNIWKAALTDAEHLVNRAKALRGGALFVGPSCSLLHSPVDLDTETKLDAELKGWLASATQKLSEISAVAKSANGQRDAAFFLENARAVGSRVTSKRIHDPAVKQRLASVTPQMAERATPFKERIALQQAALKLPLLPTTSIGSLPQTKEIRELRAGFKKGQVDQAAYEKTLEDLTAEATRWRDEIDIDVPVHGEYERNDMVEYFGEQLKGFGFTERAWVQSYGSRCVKPPIIFGDVSRPVPMTVRWTEMAQKYTRKPVKGMLTGPVTILQWSFVRDDPAAQRNLPPDRARHPRRSRGSGKGRREDHPDRRSSAARRPADPQVGLEDLSGLGGGFVPPYRQRRQAGHPGAYPYVLL
jgi:5-methyltetrahydropteroyltriglutamate--homocysteine methyltransferase